MNDADNNNTDHSAKVDKEVGLSKVDYTKPNKNNRTSDIYERFLNRVQNIDNDNDTNVSASNTSGNRVKTDNTESLERVEKTATYEPLNEEELQQFTAHEQEVDSQDLGSDSVDISFSVDDKVADAVNHVTDLSESSVDDDYKHDNDNLAFEPETNSSTNLSTKKTGASWGKQVRNSKLLIVGIVFGLLLSGLIVVTLNLTGFLAAPTDELSPNSAQTAPVDTSTPLVTSEQATNDDVTTRANDLSKAVANTDISTEAASSDNNLETAKELSAQPVSKQNQENNNNTDSDDNIAKNSNVAETDISPEDFREEAQNTLYRETKD